MGTAPARSVTDRNGSSWFSRFARRVSGITGHGASFGVAVLLVVVWLAVGPLFGFTDSWQLVINTTTTIVTFLMVFLIQNTQNRDTGAIQIKLDELIRAVRGARNEMIDLEDLDPSILEAIRTDYERLAQQARAGTSPDAGSPDRPARHSQGPANHGGTDESRLARRELETSARKGPGAVGQADRR
jgi:low affinity Fe/Cu permease